MQARVARRLTATAAAPVIALAGCSTAGEDVDEDDIVEVTSTLDCSDFSRYGDLEGTEISVYTAITEPESAGHIAAFAPFEECTGAAVDYEGDRDFESQLQSRLQAGGAPDVAYISQPGLIRTIVEGYDAALPVTPGAEALVDEHFTATWKAFGTIDDTFYGVPLGASVKSFVWYSPTMFDDGGYEVPTTLDELTTLTEEIAAAHPDTKPWCAGIESGASTGWPATDWLEDMVLRTSGPAVYDQWVAHEISFDHPEIVAALDAVGEILKNPDHVNGGLGDVRSIATTSFGEAGEPILDGTCWMMRQATFYQAYWGDDVLVAEDGDVDAFVLPGEGPEGPPMVVGADFAVAFSDRPEVQALQEYLASPEWVDAKVQASGPGWVSAHQGLDPDDLASGLDRRAFDILTDPDADLHFDGSDAMPVDVGSSAFWAAMTDWVVLDVSSPDALAQVEEAWP
jgi:alpha-glucoside transport system substrate-binding protein